MYLSEALVGEPVGLAPESDRHCAVYFGPMKLCLIDHKTNQLVKIAPDMDARTDTHVPGPTASF